MSVPEMMCAARMHAVGGPMSIDTIPVPKPGSTDVLVEVKACGMVPNLGNVLANWTRWFPHLPLPRLPAIFGLDPAGVVVEVGAQVIGVEPGERVYVNPLRSCGACRMCRSGERTRCRYFTFNGYFGFGPDAQKIYDLYPYGGFCEFMTAPQYALVKLPDNVSFEQAARFGYLGTSYGAMKKANAVAGQSMLVDGISGTLGLGAALLGLALGITRILGTGRNRQLLARVKALAPERIEVHALDDGPTAQWAKRLTGGDGVDFMISALGPGSPARTMLELAAGGPARRARGQCRRRRRARPRRRALADGRADPADRLQLVHISARPGDGGAGAGRTARSLRVRAPALSARRHQPRDFRAAESRRRVQQLRDRAVIISRLMRRSKRRLSFDHLVGEREQRARHGEVEHPGGRGVDDQLVLVRLDDR